MRHLILSFLTLAALVIAPATAYSGDTDPTGYRLKRYVEDYLQNAMPSDALAAKIKASGGADSSGVYEWLCSLEVANTLSVGYSIWENRMLADTYYMKNFSKSQFIPLNISNYCITYSNHCGHWNWSADCIKRKFAK